MIDAGIGRGDMRVVSVRASVYKCPRLGMQVGEGWLHQRKAAGFEFERVGFMQFPRTVQVIAGGEPDRTPFMMGEIEQVFRWEMVEPLRAA